MSVSVFSSVHEIKEVAKKFQENLKFTAEKLSVIERRCMSANLKPVEAVRQIWNSTWEWVLERDERYPARICLEQWVSYCNERLRCGRKPNIWLWKYLGSPRKLRSQGGP